MSDMNVRLAIAPIGWTNDDLPELGGEIPFEQCVSEMALAGFKGSEVGNKYPKDPAVLNKALGLRASTVEEFRSAVRQALAADGPVLIDAKVTTKSMTGNYESWWRVGTAQVSENPAVVEAAHQVQAQVARARLF